MINAEIDDSMIEERYQVVSVEKIDPPQGMPAGSWYRYVIGQGRSQIEGLKLGTLHAVTEHARIMADDLNSRAARSGSFYAPRKRK
jgi:hypothetical protein